MSMNEQMNHAEENILHTYNRFPVMFDHGEGCYLYDTEGKKYLDFAAGIAVNALGYHYPGYDEALKAQIDKLTHISNLYYNEPMSEAGEKLVKPADLPKRSSQTVEQRQSRVHSKLHVNTPIPNMAKKHRNMRSSQ